MQLRTASFVFAGIILLITFLSIGLAVFDKNDGGDKKSASKWGVSWSVLSAILIFIAGCIWENKGAVKVLAIFALFCNAVAVIVVIVVQVLLVLVMVANVFSPIWVGKSVAHMILTIFLIAFEYVIWLDYTDARDCSRYALPIAGEGNAPLADPVSN